MYAPNLPEPWMIHRIEQLRRDREARNREGARIPLYPPEPPPSPAPLRPEPSERPSVVVIDLA